MTRQQIKKRQEELKRQFDRAAKALKIGDVEQAGELALRLTRELPGRAAVHLLMGSVHSAAGRHERAARSFEKAVEIDPDNVEAQNNLGVAYRQLGEFAKALAAVEQALAITKKRSDVYYNLANIHKSLGNFDDARASYEKAIELDPNFVLAYNNLGTLLHQNGDSQAALKVLRAGLQIDANHPKLHYNLGLVYESLGKLEDATGEYRESLTRRPGWTDALNNLGIVYQRLNRYEDSLDTFAEILELEPSNATALNNSATVLAEQGKVDEAITYYKRALNNRPTYDHAIANISSLLERHTDSGSASEELQQLAVQYPDNHAVRLSLVEKLLDQKRREEANRHLDYLVAHQPDGIEQIKTLGKLLLAADRPDEAETCFRYVASQGDEKHRYTLDLANIYRDLGKLDQARAYVDSYRADIPGSIEADLLLAKIELDEDKPERALEILQMLKERAPDDERILVAIARAHQQMGKREQAIDAADQLVNLQGQRARPDDLSRLNDSLSLYEKAVAAFEEDHGEAWAKSLETLGKLARGEREETPQIQPLAVDELGELDEESIPLLDFGDDFDVDEEEAAAEPEDVDYLEEFEQWENDRGPSLLDLPNYGDRRGADDDRQAPPRPQPQQPPQQPQQPAYPQQQMPPQQFPPPQPAYPQQPPPPPPAQPQPTQPPQAYMPPPPPPSYEPPPEPDEGQNEPGSPAEDLPVTPVSPPEDDDASPVEEELDLSMGFPEQSPDTAFEDVEDEEPEPKPEPEPEPEPEPTDEPEDDEGILGNFLLDDDADDGLEEPVDELEEPDEPDELDEPEELLDELDELPGDLEEPDDEPESPLDEDVPESAPDPDSGPDSAEVQPEQAVDRVSEPSTEEPPGAAEKPGELEETDEPEETDTEPAAPAEVNWQERQARMFEYLEGLAEYLPPEKTSAYYESEMPLRVERLKNSLRGRKGLHSDVQSSQPPGPGGKPLTRERIQAAFGALEGLADDVPLRQLAERVRDRIRRIRQTLDTPDSPETT